MDRLEYMLDAFNARADDEISLSKYWIALNEKNIQQLKRYGYENFKQTISLNYFTWLVLPWDAQIRFLVFNMPITASFRNIIIDSKIAGRRKSGLDREKLVADTILKIKPKIICFSSSHKEFSEVARINKKIKEADSGIFSIVGGSQVTYRTGDFLDYGFDFACVGEGEATLVEFVNEIFNKSYRWSKINGLVWKNNRGDYVYNAPRELLKEEEINSVKDLVYDKIDKRYFDITINLIRGFPSRGAMLLTARGCPYSCSYCGCNLIFGKKIRFRSAESIENEIRYLKEKYDIEGVWIIDDTFTISYEHVESTARILTKYNIIWGCQSRVDTINEKLIRMMKKNGCVQIDFGVESGSQRILDEVIGKATNIRQIKDAFSLAKRYKIRTLANFMIGFPTETYEEFKATEQLADEIAANTYIFAIATPLPGTRLHTMLNEDITPEDYSLIDWNGSILTERLNKSGIKNLVLERAMLERKYSYATFIKAMFSPNYYILFLKNKHKWRRFICSLKIILGVLLKKIIHKS